MDDDELIKEFIRVAPPGSVLEDDDLLKMPVFVELEVTTPAGRKFSYRASARASRQGLARIRVPYAGEGYIVRTESGIHEVAVREDQVVSGYEIEVR